ncbi:aminoglycoside phosphotransferase family protein [Saccharothrix syringae]|uniref:Aminoglycoside phosphotransferase family protein n=2 Tax=Saccharothrix syringae TaxID=103733 RepID=A0A5Q0HDC1_SACSY|nr:aminoglycoside phosphotransferase family protein [Saccharothrix syringae]
MARVLRWAERAMAPGARVTGVRGLRAGSNPWLVRVGGAGAADAAVLRVCPVDDPNRGEYAPQVAALLLAERHDLPAPRLIAADLDGEATGAVAVLTTVVPGTSRIPRVASRERLRALGAAAASLRTAVVEPGADLPARRWAIDVEDPGVLMARDAPGSSPLLAEAVDRVNRLPVPDGPTAFVHGDLWQGNTMWVGDTFAGFIDWDCAGVGSPGVDLGNLRCDATILFGGSAADQVLAGWEEVAGQDVAGQDVAGQDRTTDRAEVATRQADHWVAYWDLVGALSTPADVAAWLPLMHEEGRTDLTGETVNHRRDAFLRHALDRLPGRSPEPG